MDNKNEERPDAIFQEIWDKKYEFKERFGEDPEALYLGRMEWNRFLSMVRKKDRKDPMVKEYLDEGGFIGMQVIQISRMFHIGIGVFEEQERPVSPASQVKVKGIPRG